MRYTTTDNVGCGDDCMDAGGRATHGAVAEVRTASIETGIMNNVIDAVRKLTTSYRAPTG